MRTTLLTILVAAGLITGLAAPVAAVPAGDPPDLRTSAGPPVELDVLFVGAHPDDESGTLSTLGQWAEYADVKAGVVTVTRGEGGGNAIGPEEGPALGRIREAEERRAVGKAGISDIFYLDTVDFYYTVSAPLTEKVWGHDATLAKVVRLVRQTRPEVVITMDPAPTPGNHGHHQYAARIAIEAFAAAADPERFPRQLDDEGLRPWRADRLFVSGARGEGTLGPDCADSFEPANTAANVYGVWAGRRSSSRDATWAQVERRAQREYASQGWAGFPDVPTDPAKIGCDYFTQIESRVPFDPHASSPEAMLGGALTPVDGGLPLGTEFFVTTRDFGVASGDEVRATVHVRAPADQPLRATEVEWNLPEGWSYRSAGGDTELGTLRPNESATASFMLLAPEEARPGHRVRVAATLRTRDGHGKQGYTDHRLKIIAPVRAQQQLLPRVADFRAWTEATGMHQLEGSVSPVLTLGSGRDRDVGVVVTNYSDAARSGTVSMDLADGFAVEDASQRFSELGPGESARLTFDVANTDPSLPTSNEGGDYTYTITTTTSAGGVSTAHPALELVPTTTIPHADQTPRVDGRVSSGEYGGPTLDLSRRWEGEECTSPSDCSATAKVSWHDDALYLAVRVTDDTLGSRLAPDDCKRHWRTDSVEIAIDPRGKSENTSTAFKAAILPVTDDPEAGNPPCYLRDADNHQGPGPRTAPSMTIASHVTSAPYEGYTVETKIPMAELPSAVDPDHMGLNLLVYDSDTQDKTGQTRIGWSTWRGVQGDPYRWGVARLEGYSPPPDRPTTPPEPILPRTALASLDSPQSIAQSVRNNVPLGGGPTAKRTDATTVLAAYRRGESVRVRLAAAGTGKAHVYVRSADARTLGEREVRIDRRGGSVVTIPLQGDSGAAKGAHVLVGFEGERGGTFSSRVPVR